MPMLKMEAHWMYAISVLQCIASLTVRKVFNGSITQMIGDVMERNVQNAGMPAQQWTYDTTVGASPDPECVWSCVLFSHPGA